MGGAGFSEIFEDANGTDAPPTTDIAMNAFTVEGGVYKIGSRVIATTTSDDAVWTRVPGATSCPRIRGSSWNRLGSPAFA